jgi:sucrose-6-phosphate hydrolase SacC (GH32 family)
MQSPTHRLRRAALAAALSLPVATLLTPCLRAQSDEPLRPRFHFTPPRHFMNDPNGLVFYKGEYHLFYQHNPFGATWGHMSWGHAVSRDLLGWQHLPVALREEDGIMIFSGSVVVDWKNTSGFCRVSAEDASCLVAIYTGHRPDRQTQNLAYSNDRGRTWTKYAGNPVVDLGLKDFRDPKVFWHDDTKRWVMVTVLPDQHKVRFFGSPDLRKWEALSDFGPAGATGGVWECPDLFPLPVDGVATDVGWVLDVDLNPGGLAGGSGGQYFVGRFDGTRFLNDNPPDRTLWVDYGKDFYATISFSDIPPADGRRIWMGWISNWLYANEEPTEVWRGAQSVPRVLGLRRTPDGIRLVQSPVAELDTLREPGAPVLIEGSTPLPPSAEIVLEAARGDWRQAALRLTNESGEEVVVGFTAEPLEVFVDRRKARAAPAHAEYPGHHAGPVRWRDGRVQARILFDRSVIEIFANDGRTVLTERVYPIAPLTRVEWLKGETVRPGAARMWTLRSVWDTPSR